MDSALHVGWRPVQRWGLMSLPGLCVPLCAPGADKTGGRALFALCLLTILGSWCEDTLDLVLVGLPVRHSSTWPHWLSSKPGSRLWAVGEGAAGHGSCSPQPADAFGFHKKVLNISGLNIFGLGAFFWTTE